MNSIPTYAEPLAPYLNTRDKVLEIRRALSLHLQSQITFVDDAPPSHLSLLCGAHDDNVDSVNDIPADLGNGLSAQYLRALQANVAARKQYNSALEELTRLKDEKRNAGREAGSGPGPGPAGQGRELLAYMSVLRARREREKLQVFQHYLAKLNDMEAAQQDYLTSTGGGGEGNGMSPYHSRGVGPDSVAVASSDGPVGGTDVDAIIHDLERTTLLAQRRLDCERKKRDNARIRQGSADVEASVKLKALSRVRDELVQWAEESLASAAVDDSNVPQDMLANRAGADGGILVSLDVKRARVRAQYEKYLASRQALLAAAVSSTTLPLPTTDDSNPSPRTALPSLESEPQNTAGSTSILPYTSRNLLPLSKAQKATAMQRSYTSAMLEKEKWTASKVLGRLQEESHLLPKYPMFEKQLRLKHALATITNRRRPSLVRPESEEKPATTKIAEHAEAWAFASAAAGNTTDDFIEDKLALGMDMARTTEDTLREIYQTMDRDYDDDVAVETEGQARRDRWAPSARAMDRRKSAIIFEKQVKSPWSGLDGKVGVLGGG